MERRLFINAALRAESYASGARVLKGYAARYNVVTNIAGEFHERLALGAFAAALQRGDEVKFLADHSGLPFARTKNGTLKLTDDKQGLFFSASLPQTQAAADLFELVKSGTMDECSFAFAVAPGDDEWDDDYDCPDSLCCARGSRRLPLRTVKSLRLYDCSVVGRPAYPQTSIGASMKAGPDDVSSENIAYADEDEDDDAGDPWSQYSVVVSAEARARARRSSRTAVARQALDYAANLFKAQVKATRTLVGGQ